MHAYFSSLPSSFRLLALLLYLQLMDAIHCLVSGEQFEADHDESLFHSKLGRLMALASEPYLG